MEIFSRLITLILICFAIMFHTCELFAQTADINKKSQLITLIDKEIRMIESLRSYDSTIQFRLIELYAEKIKILQEKENQELISSAGTFNVARKKEYFRQTTGLYHKMRALAKKLEKDNRHYPQIAHVYYIMAINSRDFDQSKETINYLQKALAEKNISPSIKHKSHVALAEQYYNDKTYRSAIVHYQIVIKNTEDQWLTKHYYNLSWCYFKMKEFTPAIESLEQSFYLGRNKLYLSIEDQALDTVSIFHTNGGRVERAIAFFTKNLEKPQSELMKLAERAAKKGDRQGANLSIATAIDFAKEDTHSLIDIHRRSLYIQREFGDKTQYFFHMKSIEVITIKQSINEDVRAEIFEEIRSYTGFIQEKFVKQAKQLSQSEKHNALQEVLKHFDVLINIDRSKKSEMIFFKAETFYAIEDYKSAAKLYISGILWEKENNQNSAIIKKLLDALLSSIEKAQFTHQEQQNYLVFTYENYIQLFPKEEITRAIYPKMANLYLAQNKALLAEKTLERYIQAFIPDQALQQKTAIAIIDYYIRSNNRYSLAKWVEKIRQGHLHFEDDYIEKAHIILANMIFITIKKQENTNTTDESIQKYLDIYKDPHYPARIKEEAAFNLSVMNLKKNDTEQSLKWMTISNKLRDKAKSKLLAGQLQAIATQYYLLQDFKSAIALTEYLLKIECDSSSTRKNELYYQLLLLYLATNNKKDLLDANKYGVNCSLNPSKKTEYDRSILKKVAVYDISFAINFSTAFDLGRSKDLQLLLRNSFWSEIHKGNKKEASIIVKKLIAHYQHTNDQTIKDENDQLLSWYLWEEENSSRSLSSITAMAQAELEKAEFDQNAFSGQIELILEKLNEIEKHSTKFITSTDVNIVIATTSSLAYFFDIFANQLTQLKAKSSSLEFNQSIESAMASISKKLQRKATVLRQNAIGNIKNNEVLSPCTIGLYPQKMEKEKCQNMTALPYIITDIPAHEGK